MLFIVLCGSIKSFSVAHNVSADYKGKKETVILRTFGKSNGMGSLWKSL